MCSNNKEMQDLIRKESGMTNVISIASTQDDPCALPCVPLTGSTQKDGIVLYHNTHGKQG